MSDLPAGLIGGLGMTEVHVYAQHRAPDGQFSGCPHVHAITEEAYYVLRGTGAVELHDLQHGYRREPLKPGDYMHFSPLVMHRLVSDGDLVILGIMGNAGLPEAGDARVYFGAEVDASPDLYAERMSLAQRRGLEGALQRRDLAVEAYQTLVQRWQEDRAGYFAELKRFFGVHLRAAAASREAFGRAVAEGPARAVEQARDRLANLPGGIDMTPSVASGTERATALGMCGVLRPIRTRG